jgi:hypothetical protein
MARWYAYLIPDAYSELLLYAMAVGATIFVAGILYVTINIIEWYTKEPIIKYEIAVPAPPGDGRAVEKPSIKVRAAYKISLMAANQT